MNKPPSGDELRDEMKRDLAYVQGLDRIVNRCMTFFVFASLGASLLFLYFECRKQGWVP